MDTVQFHVVATPHWYGNGIQIRINGIAMTELVRAVELPFAKAEGHPKFAGAYSPLPASKYLPPSRHLFGEREDGRAGGKVELLCCSDCGEIGCWPLLARITISPAQVIWSDFEQPHRSDPEEVAVWQYYSLGPFVFDKRAYEAELAKAAGERSEQ